ncbi:tetratricopeptide repeat protein [Methylocystis sp. WRRC1]|uniref:heme biosynthesis protein HemY n=1 Tax=Methylocystis sp. WRRC1 TaxID=1732014 RepID=UPI001D149790|nr:heme biosynthesis HemY N-terminal domain-containing protein [Methylocystis sp. WRRC1]MCC3245722.1 tetratricopeptide repeat protein [Methylocystis sp. WRRC1]
MLFLFFFILALAVVALGLEWLIEQPGSLTLEFAGWHMEASIPVAVAGLLLLIATVIVVWAIVVALIRLPRRMAGGSRERRRERGLDVISQGLVAVGAGDLARARKAAALAERLLPGEPLTQMLNAQAAQLSGDHQAAAKAFHKMTLKPETKLLGLRGLHIEAKRRQDAEAAHHFAKAAHEIAPLPWAGSAVLEHHAAGGDWEKARAAVEANLAAKAIDAATAQNLRAVIETAMAMEKEREHPHDALRLARQALKRRPGFPPAAATAARVLIHHGDRKQALKLIETVWATKPHPDLAEVYFEALPDESNSQRVTRIEKLARLAPDAPESRHILAQAALSARDFTKAREALAPLVAAGQHPTAHTCLLMAEIEDAQNGPSGPVREWLARGSRAPRDPAWIADGVVSKHWLPISPVSGKLDAFEWKIPPHSAQHLTEEGQPNIPAAFLARQPASLEAPASGAGGAAQ